MTTKTASESETAEAGRRALRIPIVAFGMSLSIYSVITYVLCILFYLAYPEAGGAHKLLTLMLPWFDLLSWTSFVAGLVQSYLLGWYVALVFGPIYNLCIARFR